MNEYSPKVARVVSRTLAASCRLWFRYRMEGLENIPSEPSMLVGNHSGIGIADALCMLGEAPKVARRVTGMMHDIFVSMPFVGWLFRKAGAVRAHPDAARRAFARGDHVLVFPGGNLDSCRPFTMERDVVFGARRGYVRIALEQRVPIVPIVTFGSHRTYLLLPWIGDAIGRVLRGTRLMRDERIPVPVATLLVIVALATASPAWIALAVTLLVIPTPTRVTSRVLPPIDVVAATAHIADANARVEAAHALVHGALARALRSFERESPSPIKPMTISASATLKTGQCVR